MRRMISMAVFCAMILGPMAARADRKSTAQGQQGTGAAASARIDMVIALDTSGSMGGLIDAARQKLWDIVNEAARAKPSPVLRVGLVTFGSSGSESDGYVIVQSDLTTDLDAIYEKLFALRTSGGTEYVGRAVFRSLNEMSWDRQNRTLRQIFVAGNESADQDGRVPSARAVKLARRQGVFVNAIYCGGPSDFDAPSWKRVASGGKGVFASIDHNHGTVMVATPYDARINALSERLNRTYVAYGAKGVAAKENQARQDDNAKKAHSGVAAARAQAKASAVYRAESWDLVDARKRGKLAAVPRADLPAEMQTLDESALNKKLDELQKDRETLQKEIRDLAKKRTAHVAAEMKRAGKSEDKAFDHAVKRAVRDQAESLGIAME